MLRLKNQKGFTLIEIIAVLVILGILAAVAIPKFLDLQEQSRAKAIEGGIAAGASQLHMNFASSLLAGAASATSWTYGTNTGIVLGDFTATLTGACGTDAAIVSLTAGPSWFAAATATKTRKYTVCD